MSVAIECEQGQHPCPLHPAYDTTVNEYGQTVHHHSHYDAYVEGGSGSRIYGPVGVAASMEDPII